MNFYLICPLILREPCPHFSQTFIFSLSFCNTHRHLSFCYHFVTHAEFNNSSILPSVSWKTSSFLYSSHYVYFRSAHSREYHYYWVQPIENCCHRILHHPVATVAWTSTEQIIYNFKFLLLVLISNLIQLSNLYFITLISDLNLSSFLLYLQLSNL